MKNKLFLASIIITNYNGQRYLHTCLSSVLKTHYTNLEVIIVDDGSDDGSIEIIKSFAHKDKRIKFIENDKNIGAAASRNRAGRVANGNILVFLDNDTEVEKNWLSEMIKTLLKDKRVGACQAKLIDFEKRDRIQVVGVKIWAATGWGLSIGHGEKDTGQYDKEIKIVAISAAMAVKKDVFEKVGGFDEDEAVVTEDLDLSWRIWIAGYKIVLSSKSIVYHWTKSVEMRKNMKHSKEKIYFHLTKNSLISIIKNYELPNAIKYILCSIFISLGRAIMVFVKRKDKSCLRGTLKGILFVFSKSLIILKHRTFVQQTRVYGDQTLFDLILVRRSLFYIYKSYFIKTNLL